MRRTLGAAIVARSAPNWCMKHDARSLGSLLARASFQAPSTFPLQSKPTSSGAQWLTCSQRCATTSFENKFLTRGVWIVTADPSSLPLSPAEDVFHSTSAEHEKLLCA